MKIDDWDVAYNNSLAVKNAAALLAGWSVQGAAYQADRRTHAEQDLSYGPGPRELLDIYLPEGDAHGTLVFVHGGYWQSSDKNEHAQFAEGARARGWRVVVVDYPLCPQVSIRQITESVCRAIEYVGQRYADGPLVLAGHSAGGHLVTYAVSQNSGLSKQSRSRIQRVISISGLHDLRPIVRAGKLNAALGLDNAEASQLSPALSTPGHAFELICVCGTDELSELRRQNALLASIWLGLGISTDCLEVAGRNHFSVMEALKTPFSHLSRLATLSEEMID
ncbi:alpha/beta hydrolase [Ectopseudomonas mendocina]|uniref:Alpha/beta hydrolase n=1 Tax=Ectopseudomonas mendocina TaxID=300 RepID=A0ABZ2RJM4_ECTME